MIGGDQQLHPHVRLREIVDGVVRLLPDQLDIRAIGDHLTTEINPHPLLAIFDPHATTIHRFPLLETTWINSARALDIPVGWIQPCPTRSFGPRPDRFVSCWRCLHPHLPPGRTAPPGPAPPLLLCPPSGIRHCGGFCVALVHREPATKRHPHGPPGIGSVPPSLIEEK